MRILFFGNWVSTQKSGAEVRADCMVNALAKAGATVDFIAIHPNNQNKILRNDAITIYYVGLKNTFLKKIPINLVFKNINYLQFLDLLFSSYSLVKSLVSSYRYKAIIGLDAHFLTIVAELFSRSKKIPFIIDQTQDSIENTHNRFILYNASRMLSRSNMIVTSSKYYAKFLEVKFNLPILSKTVLIPNWIDTKKFYPTMEKNLYNTTKPQILAMGRIDAFANYITLSKELTSLNFDHEIIVVGGEMKRIYEQTIKKSLQNNFKFLGYVPDEFLPHIIEEATFCPIFYNKKMMCPPAKILPLMAMQKVIISRRFPGIDGILNDNNAVLLSDSADIKQYANAIVEKYPQKQYLINIGKNARDKINIEFSSEKTLERINYLLEKLK